MEALRDALSFKADSGIFWAIGMTIIFSLEYFAVYAVTSYFYIHHCKSKKINKVYG